VDQQTGTHHGEHHQAECQLQNGALVAEQTLLGNAPSVQEQQRRQEQQEEHVRVQRVAAVEHAGNDRAQTDLYQRQRQRERQDPDQIATGHDGHQHGQNYFNDVHSPIQERRRGRQAVPGAVTAENYHT